MANLDAAVREIVNGDLLPGQSAGDLVRLEDEHHPVVLDRQRLDDGALDAPGEAAV